MSLSPDSQPLETVSLDLSDEQLNALIDLYCAELSPGARQAYREALDERSAQGADGVSARQAALYQAIAHQAVETALERAVSAREALARMGAGGAGQSL